MNYFEKFLSSAERLGATYELASLGKDALPILESLFDGSAKNKFGVPYSQIGVTSCGYLTCELLGNVARPLEYYIRLGIEEDECYAISAAGFLLQIEDETALALARALVRNPYSEAGASLIRCSKTESFGVVEIINSNTIAAKSFEQTKSYMLKYNE